MQTVRGQCLDLITAPSGGKVDFTDFTEDRYNTIVKWKTGYYSFYLPVAIAMYMVGHFIVQNEGYLNITWVTHVMFKYHT